ncbi:MAG: ATP synthase F1 subunit epsilon [Bryobacteraceae bacterium]
MAETFELEIATPERLLVHERVVSAQIPAENGYLGVLPGHAPLFAQLGIDTLSYVNDADRRFTLLVSQGFIEVRDNRVRVLADVAELGSEIDQAGAEKELRDAQERMANPAPDTDTAAVLVNYRNAMARVAAAQQAAENARQVKG